MTANAFDEDRRAGEEARMSDFITKPVEPDELYRTLQRWLTTATDDKSDAQRIDALPVALRAPATTREQKGFPLVLADFDGLDTVQGLAALRGNEAIYLKLLRQFAARHGRDAEHLRDELAAGQVDAASRRLHSLKGVAGTLGVIAVYSTAVGLEQAMYGNAQSTVLAAMVDTLQNNQKALDEVLARLGAEPDCYDNGVADPARARALLERLEHFLSSCDTDAAHLFEANRAFLLSALGPNGNLLARQLMDFDYPGALATVRIALREMPNNP